jgi:hypothetical protein
MTWLMGLFGGAVMRWLIGGAFAAAIVAGAIAWHKWNFVSRAEVQRWKDYSQELLAASAEKERLGIQAEKEREDAEQKIEELERENERLHEEDKKALKDNDPIIIGPDDLKRLRRSR